MNRLRSLALLLALALTSQFASLGHTQTAYPGDGTTATGIAQWKLTNTSGTAMCRYYAVDNESGVDTRVGYYDSTVGATFTTELTTRAIKTLERLREIMPRFGNGRCVVALLKARSDAGNFLKKNGSTSDWLDIGYQGYSYLAWRGSDLTNSTNDHADLGGVIASNGPNGDLSWTVSAQAGFEITNSAGTLDTEDNLAGLKLQFQGNITSASRTNGDVILARTAATKIETGRGTTVANGDKYFIVAPGVKVTTIVGSPGHVDPSASASVNTGPLIAGIRFTATTGTLNWYDANLMYSFCRFDGAYTVNSVGAVRADTIYVNESGATVNERCGVDFRNTFSSTLGSGTSWNYSAWHNTAAFAFGSGSMTIASASYSLLAPTVQQIVGGIFNQAGLGNGPLFGSPSTTFRHARMVAGVAFKGCQMTIGRVDIVTATTGLAITGEYNNLTVGTVIGTAGTTLIDLSSARNSSVIVESGTSATGTTQDILMAGSVTSTIASLATSGQYDAMGNTAEGSAGRPLKRTVLKFSGDFVGAAGAKTDFLADSGPIAGSVLDAVPVSYPMPAVRCRNLRVQAPTNPLGANLVVRVLKNGGASGITATITTGSTALFSDVTHEAQWTAGDVLDVDMTETGAGTAKVAATLECY